MTKFYVTITDLTRETWIQHQRQSPVHLLIKA